MCLAQHGSLDTSFGDQGNAILYIGEELSLSNHSIDQGVTGRIATSTAQYGVLIDEAYIRAFLDNGSIDTSFGNNGEVYVNLNGLGPFGAIHVLEDNSILYTTGAGSVLRKLRPNGLVDGYFGTAGTLTMEGQSFSGEGHNLLPDGSIFLVGFTNQVPRQLIIKKYDSEGDIDISFANQGTAAFNIGSFYQIGLKTLLIKPDSSIIANYSLRTSPNNPYTAYMLKLSPNGVLDTTFGNNGIKTLSIDNSEKAKFYLNDDDHMLVSYYYYDQQLSEYIRRIIKLKPDGEVDTGFANNGILIDHSVEIVEQNQRIITNSTIPDSAGGMYPSLHRIFPNGDIDNSFNFEYTYSELSTIRTASSPHGDFLLSGGDILYNGPDANLLISKYKSTPLGIEESLIDPLKIYPNPSKGNFIVKLGKLKENLNYQIVDVLGRVVLNGIFTTHVNNIDLSQTKAGVYFLQMGETTYKLLKE